MSGSIDPLHIVSLGNASRGAFTNPASRMFRSAALWVVLLFGATHSGVVEAQSLPTRVTVEVVSASPIVVPVNQALAEPIRIRVRNAQSGAPVAGVVVHVSLNFVICFPLPPPPPPAPTCEEYYAMLFGGFGNDPDGWMPGLGTTDAEGIASVTGFHSGSIPGSYDMVVGVSASNNGGLFESPSPGLLLGVIQTDRQSSAPRTIPVADSRSLALLVAMMMLAGFLGARHPTRG